MLLWSVNDDIFSWPGLSSACWEGVGQAGLNFSGMAMGWAGLGQYEDRLGRDEKCGPVHASNPC